MGRVTRNSNGASKVPTTMATASDQHQNDNGRLTLIKPSPKRGRVKKGLNVIQNGVVEPAETPPAPTPTVPFEFSTEVPFKYSPRHNGFGTVLEFMRRGDETVKQKILDECNLILECRACNNFFRSPRDFVTHKDKYCKVKYERISPAGLKEILRLAQNSFKVNESVSSSVSIIPPPVASTSDNVQTSPGSDLSFDVNHLVPMLSTVLTPSAAAKQAIHLQPAELELQMETAEQNASMSGPVRQLPRDSNGEIAVSGKYKSKKMDKAALIGADGKAAVIGKPSSIQQIVDRLTAQWESKLEEESKLIHLKCHICHMACPTEKALRVHVRKDHQNVKIRRKKSVNAVNGVTKRIKKVLFKEVEKSVNTDSKVESKGSLHKSTKCATESKQNKERKSRRTMPETKGKPSRSPASFRRLTNNSFSATLGLLSPDIVPNLNSLREAGPPRKKSKQQRQKSTESLPPPLALNGSDISPDYKAKVKALFLIDKKERKVAKGKSTTAKAQHRPSPCPPSPRKVSCLKCLSEFGEKEMSVHLGNCHGSQNSINRIGIIDRHDYVKAQSDGELCVINGHPFNNNENEIVGEPKECASTNSFGEPEHVTVLDRCLVFGANNEAQDIIIEKLEKPN